MRHVSHSYFFFQASGAHRYLHSFPTRRSSDLRPTARPRSSRLSPNGGSSSCPITWSRRSMRRRKRQRSEEHTSELQSHSDLVCRLLLEKKKKISTTSSV